MFQRKISAELLCGFSVLSALFNVRVEMLEMHGVRALFILPQLSFGGWPYL